MLKIGSHTFASRLFVGTGKMGLDGGVSEFFNIIKSNGFGILHIREKYVRCLETLPLIGCSRDYR
jgi:thiazole synthase ThiGH ThiG subunit